MKLFSIFNKPATKANNKQAGLVFLEYVIMAFIVTVAVICALWWFYWHLQQMTWEVKAKLDTLKTLNCELGKPGGPESVQPTPADVFYYEGTSEIPLWTDEIPYPNQKAVIHNMGGGTISFDVYFLVWIDDLPIYPPDWYISDIQSYDLGSGDTKSFEHNHEWHGYPGPYSIVIYSSDAGTPYSVTISPG